MALEGYLGIQGYGSWISGIFVESTINEALVGYLGTQVYRHLFKGIRESFENLEWNSRDIKVPGFWGYSFKLLYDFRDSFQNNFRDTG